MIKLIFLGLAGWWAYLVSQDNWGEGLYVITISALLYFNIVQFSYNRRIRDVLGRAIALLKEVGRL